MLPENVEEEPGLRDKVDVFRDRTDAGELLAGKLLDYADRNRRAIVVAVPSGGVPVGYAVAKRLGVPLDVVLVRKVPIPWEPEAGFGSVTLDGSVFLNRDLIRNLQLSKSAIAESVTAARSGLEERARRFAAVRKNGVLENIESRSVILIDDGLASGFTMVASVDSIRKRKPTQVVVAIPTGSLSAVTLVARKVNRLVCLNIRSGYSFAVAEAYKEWYDVSEEEALKILALAKADR